MELFFNIVSVIICILLITATAVSISKYRLTTKKQKWYIYYIIFVFVIEFLSYTMLLLKFKDYNFLYPIYIAGEFFIITALFIKKLHFSKYYFIVTVILSLIFLIADKILLQYNNDYSKAISNLTIVCLISYSLIQDIKNIKNKSPFQVIDKMFFLYFIVSIFIFLFQHQLLAFPVNYFYSLWIINNLMSCILYILFIKTFLSLKR